MTVLTYGQAIHSAFYYLLDNYPEVFTIGQGLWSPWYVGNTMKDLEKTFGTERVIDSPVSELATTGAAVGASLNGSRPIVIHPRMDFMLLANDAIINQAAKWSYMLGGQARPNVTIRGIINRGGEQGAQHSQALHAHYAHIPGLRVVMPATVADARDLLIASVLCDDPVLYIDDRWSYDQTATLDPIVETPLSNYTTQCLQTGQDITLAACGYSVKLAQAAAQVLAEQHQISAEVINCHVINPFNADAIVESVTKTGRLCAVDGSWRTCGFASEIIASVSIALPPNNWRSAPQRVTLPDAPAPTSSSLEKAYYPTVETVVAQCLECL